jgi:hypothetical protein
MKLTIHPDLKNAQSYTSTASYVFIAWCLTENMIGFYLLLSAAKKLDRNLVSAHVVWEYDINIQRLASSRLVIMKHV